MDEAILAEILGLKAPEITQNRMEAQGIKPEFRKLLTSKKHKLLSIFLTAAIISLIIVSIAKVMLFLF